MNIEEAIEKIRAYSKCRARKVKGIYEDCNNERCDDMTENEAIEWIKELKGSEEIQEFYYVESFIKAFDVAIQALEKQIPKRLDVEDSDRGKCCICPSCGGFIGYMVDCKDDCYQDNYCPSCGQNLDWSDKDEIN